ncbi:MAG: STAS domain-containing protein, partial [Alphaproteobacteria bacterium]
LTAMEITRELRDGEASLALSGRLDAAWSDGVSRALDECIRAGAHVVRLDMGDVSFVSSAGLRVLLTAYRQLSKIGGRLSIVRASEAVRSVLDLGGLSALLDLPASGWAETAPGPPPSALGRAPVATAPDAPSRRFDHRGAAVESWSLDAAARVRLRSVGDPESLLEGRTPGAGSVRSSFGRSAFGLGAGAFGADAGDCRDRFGEFLAVGGAAVCLAGADDAVPDWVVAADRLVPEVEVLWGLVGEGSFSVETRFEAAQSEAGALPFLDVATLLLEATGSPAAAFVMLAETEQLVGAALRVSPVDARTSGSAFAFPAVRDRLLFTAEPAWPGALSLSVGVVAREMPPALAPQSRPLSNDGSLSGHVHTAVFPYRPLRKGRLTLDAAIAAVFEDQSVRG